MLAHPTLARQPKRSIPEVAAPSAPWSAAAGVRARRRPSTHVQVRAGEHLVRLEDVRAAEHLARRAARVGLGEVLALGPGDEVREGPPPGLHLVVALPVRVLRPGAALVVELHRPRAVYLVADEAGMAVHEMDAPPEAVLEVDLMAPADGNAVGHHDHGRSLARPGADANGQADGT